MRNERFLRDLDWNLIFIFQVIVEAGGITAAAERLLRTQPSVSNALSRLETSVGHRLIHRARGTFRLTEYGQLFREETLRVVHGVERIAQMAGDSAEPNRYLHLLLANQIDSPLFDKALATFHARHPGVKIEIEVAPSGIVVERVRGGEVAIGICILNRALPDLACRYLGSTRMGFYCGRRHPLFGREGLTLDDLDAHNYISFESDHLEAGLDAVARVGIGNRFRDNRIASSANDEEILRLIEAGIGFGPLNVSMGTLYVQAGRLWSLPPYDDLPTVRNYVLTNPTQLLTREDATFIEVLESLRESETQDDEGA
ncbi:LysR family transcriptional regulator [Allorhizobium borbori]|uniref:DNA-binding transcriptional LysR family regulator n=1 Tax=Allorhizobium borbori TaxID=485907 RepID=A0A7W6NZI4_9HYPH|nr:LysR family transcriptional regulator [Allorhizobium borbori]MBB4102274.1 DNA-binding transcriptional LysR family regulator [Allorhizobium borbori]